MQSFISCVRCRTIKIIFHAGRLADINERSNEFLLLDAKVAIRYARLLYNSFQNVTNRIVSLIRNLFFFKDKLQ